MLGKQHRDSFPKKSESRALRVLELVYSDVCGKISVPSLGKSCYFVTFIDDYSRYAHVYMLQAKSQVLEAFKEFVAMAENQSGQKLKRLRSDNGGEYKSKGF